MMLCGGKRGMGISEKAAKAVERREKLKEIRVWDDCEEGQQRRYLKASLFSVCYLANLTNPYEQLAPCTRAEVPTTFSFRIPLHIHKCRLPKTSISGQMNMGSFCLRLRAARDG